MNRSHRPHAMPARFVRRALTQAILATCLLPAATLPAAAKFKDIAPEADANVSESAPTSNYGGDTKLVIQSGDGTALNKRAWLRFDLAGRLPPGATVTAAKLRLYVFNPDQLGDPLTLRAFGQDNDSWTETGITWSNQPLIGADDTPGAGNTASTHAMEPFQSYRWVELDVTDYVLAQLAGDQKVSLRVGPQTEGENQWRTYEFNSREYHTNFAPRLRLEYSGDWPASDVVNIIHANDIHSRLTAHDYDFPDGPGEAPALVDAGGAARMAAKILERKQANMDSLVLDAGDISEGNPLGDLRVNGGMVDYLSLLDTRLKALPGNTAGRGLDAVVIGNHDVRDAQMILNMKATNLPFLAVNMLKKGVAVPSPTTWQPLSKASPSEADLISEAYTHPFRPYVMVDTQSNAGTPTRVAVLGYLTDDSAILSESTEALIAVKETRWSDSDADTVDLKDWVAHLRKPQAEGGEGADVVILLTHIGHRRLVAGDEILLGDQGDVAPPDAAVSGHWHTWAETGWQPANLNYNTFVTEAASYAQYVGEFQLAPNGRYVAAQKHPIDASVIPDSPVASLVDTLIAEYDAIRDPARACVLPPPVTGRTYADQPCPLDHVVGYSAVDLKLDKDKWFTLSEFPWSGDNAAGEWIADATVWKLAEQGVTAHLALQSGGGVRRDVKAGPVTYMDIYETYPWTDDQMVVVTMTSKDIWDYLEDHYVGSSISQGWQVSADDGQISAITYHGTPLVKGDTGTTWQVAISAYMFLHDDWISESGSTYDFQSKPNSAYTFSIRDAVVEYTAQFGPSNPMTVSGPRYVLNTELAGGFRAVVTMVNDAENEPYFEAVFVRLLEALPETLARRDQYGLADLVNPDGGINPQHEFAETMLYRSHLGFPDGVLKVGDIIEVWGEGGFFAGNPQLVDQQGVVAQDTEFTFLGHDPALAAPEFMQATDDFWDEAHENRLVKFRAERTGDHTVRDVDGTEISVYKEGGFYYADMLPGSNGDTLELIGVQTQRDADRRFRLREAAVASGYPPSSTLSLSAPLQVGVPVTLTATATDLNGYVTPTCPSGGNVFAKTSFENAAVPGGDYDDPASAASDHALATIAGEPIVNFTAAGGELGFTSWYYNTRDDVGLTDGDFVGVTNFVDTTAPYTSPQAYTDGGKGYEFNDPDGLLRMQLDTVSLAGKAQASVCVDLFLADTSWETGTVNDRAKAWVQTDDGTVINLFSTSGDIDNLSGVEGVWKTYAASLTGHQSATLYVELDSNASDENLFVDNIRFKDVAPQTGGVGTVAQVRFQYSTDGGQTWQTIATDSNGADGWSAQFTPAGAGDYLFRSIATDSDGLVEPAPVVADASAQAHLPQDIDFPALADRSLDQSPFVVSAVASSGLPVSFSSLTSSVCDVSGNNVSLLAMGLCEIAANQTGDSQYAAADQVVRGFNVTAAEPYDGDVPLPAWALALLGMGLLGVLRRHVRN